MRVENKWLACLFTAAVASAFTPVARAAVLETEAFNSEASAASVGWTGYHNRSSPHNYGFSNTNNTLGTSGAGEAGGVIARAPANFHAYYADTSLGGNYSLNDRMEGSGEIVFTVNPGDAGALFGHFDAPVIVAGQFNRSQLGFSVNEQNSTSVRVRPLIIDAGSTPIGSTNTVLTTRDGSNNPIPFFYEYVYDPAAGSNGQISLKFTNLNDSSIPVNVAYSLTASERSFTVVLNAFGIMTVGPGGTSTPEMQAFIDNVTYTAPEPSALAVLSLASLMLLRRRGRTD